ncbi:transposase [Streptomyces sp. NPDC014764]|uniref:transposase n=1 Tax=Streptomyces sp. NPDC014764 TaxID=3364907 RepID=UPI0036FD883F
MPHLRERAPQPGARPVQRRPDQQDPPGLRRWGRPLAFTVTGGNTNHCTQFTAVMQTIRVPRPGPTRPRVRPGHVIGGKGYSAKAIRTWLRRRDILHTVPERSDHSLQTGSDAAVKADARRPSTSGSASGATSSNGTSTASSSSARSPPATTRPPSPTKQPSPSYRC